MTGFIVASGMLAVGLTRIYRLIVPARIDLIDAVRRWDGSRELAMRRQRSDVKPATKSTGRLQARITERVVRHVSGLSGVGSDLEITSGSIERYVGKAIGIALVGFFVPVVAIGYLRFLGLELPVAIGPTAGILISMAVPILVRRELSRSAQGRRSEFRRALSIYLDLVAMSMQAGRGHAEALPASASVGDGWAFTHLRDALDGARFSGTTPWRALGELGDRLGVRELVDLEAAMSLANDDGVRVRATLVARAAALRSERLADAESAAALATESMRFALIVMVFAFLSYELYPSIARLFSA